MREQKENFLRKTPHISRRKYEPGVFRNILRQAIRIGGNHRKSGCKRVHHAKTLRLRRAHHRENIRRPIHIGEHFRLQVAKKDNVVLQSKFGSKTPKRCLGSAMPCDCARNIRNRFLDNRHRAKHHVNILFLRKSPGIYQRVLRQSELLFQTLLFFRRAARRKIRKLQRIGKYA